MRYIAIALSSLLILAGTAFAVQVTKQITVIWDYPVAAEDTIAGFKVFNQDAGAPIFDNISPSQRTVSGPYTYDDSVPQSFHIVSFGADGQQSTPSNIKTVTPPYKPLVGVGTFTIELK